MSFKSVRSKINVQSASLRPWGVPGELDDQNTSTNRNSGNGPTPSATGGIRSVLRIRLPFPHDLRFDLAVGLSSIGASVYLHDNDGGSANTM
jgi:hypothetical protein